ARQGTAPSPQATLTGAVPARLHIIVETEPGHIPNVDPEEVERRLAEVARSWEDKLREALVAARRAGGGRALTLRYRNAFPASYQDRFGGDAAVYDVELIERALATDGLT